MARLLLRMSRASLIFCLMPAAHAASPPAATGQEDTAGEYELKAAMLYNLTRFVEWPSSVYPDSQAPIVLCILGRDPFGGSLASLAAKQTANGKAMQIRHLQSEKEAGGCHVLYISSSERKALARIFANLKGASVLTVGEMAQFAAYGGMIQFDLEDKQVHFVINLGAASRTGLRISSRLLVLAKIVKEQSSNSGSGSGAVPAQAFRDDGSHSSATDTTK